MKRIYTLLIMGAMIFGFSELSAQLSICAGESVHLKSDETQGPDKTLVWQESEDGETFTDIPDSDTTDLMVTPMETTHYRFRVHSDNCDIPLISDPQEVEVTDACNGQRTVTYNGRTYDLIPVGCDQCWFQENLDTDEYNDGTPIPEITNGIDWQNATTAEEDARCYYDNDDSHAELYGQLYNRIVVNNQLNVCPTGFKVPSHQDFMDLVDYVENTYTDSAALSLKDAGYDHWEDPQNAQLPVPDNSSGFTVMPAGVRQDVGNFSNEGRQATFWSSTDAGGQQPRNKTLQFNDMNPHEENDGNTEFNGGASIRCLKE